MIRKPITRYPKKVNNFYFLKGKKIISIDCKTFYKKNKIDSEIKLLKSEFRLINKNMIKLTHFNLQRTRHKINRRYLIISIDKQGYFNGKKYKAPLFQNKFILVKCFYSKNYIDYKDLKKNIFKNSLNNIKNVASLKKAIIKRYKISLPHITKSRLLSAGIAVTKLKVIKVKNHSKVIHTGNFIVGAKSKLPYELNH